MYNSSTSHVDFFLNQHSALGFELQLASLWSSSGEAHSRTTQQTWPPSLPVSHRSQLHVRSLSDILAAALIALISTTVFILTIIGIATLAYLRNRLPVLRYPPAPSTSRNSVSYAFYQYDPNPKHTPTASEARMSLLVVSPSCPIMVPLHSDSQVGVQMMQVMITPPSPVKTSVTTANLV